MVCDMNYQETALKQQIKENTFSALTFLTYQILSNFHEIVWNFL